MSDGFVIGVVTLALLLGGVALYLHLERYAR